MSATNMALFLLLGFSLLLYHEIEGITTHSVTGCSDRVLLNCSINEMIHVERITFYNGTDCNQAVTNLQVCGQPVTGSDTGLVPACNGKISCNEILYHSYCPGSKAAKLDYRCIPRNNVKDMCDEFIIENTNRIFLSTPNFPSTPTFTDISPCRCFIRGSNITSIQILELVLHTSHDGTKSSLEINYGDVTYKTESFSDTLQRLVYNKRLSTTSTTAEIIFNHNNLNRQYLWIEVQGVSMLAVCTTAPAPTSTKLPTTTTTKTSTVPPTPSSSSSSLPTSLSSSSSTTSSSFSSSSSSSTPSISSSSLPSSTSSTPSSSSSSSSSSPSFPVSSSPASTESPSPTESSRSKQNQDNDKDRQTIIAVSVVLSLCLLLICIAVIVVCILFRKGKIAWVKKSPQVERESSPYSGLDLNQRVAGNDGTYQELSTRNSTPQYNNVSQNNHRDYYNLN